MLFRTVLLERLAKGEVDLAFRRWERARVKKGSRLRTAVGVLEVVSVDVVPRVSGRDARRAGFDSLEALRKELDSRRGSIFRVKLRLAGEDPRIALRKRAGLSADELQELEHRLDRLDRASRRGPWTGDVLSAIATNPSVRAADLARRFGRETLDFKRDVRKLKELGLTESLEVGYRLSPRGRAFLSKRPTRSGARSSGRRG